jgi:hypothetical protein
MQKWVYCIAFLATLVILAGCGARYYMNSDIFSSSSEALQKQSEILSHSLDAITPTVNPVHGNTLVLIPSNVEIQNNYLIIGNNATELENEQINYMITSTSNDSQFIANAISKRAIFGTVSVARHNGNPTTFPIGDYDFVVFLDVDGWFIKGKDNPRVLPIPFDNSISDIEPRRLAFLNLLNQQAHLICSK